MHEGVAPLRVQGLVENESLIDDEVPDVFGKLHPNSSPHPFEPELRYLPRCRLLYPKLGRIVESRDLHSDGVIGTAAALPDSIDRNGKQFRSREFRPSTDRMIGADESASVALERMARGGLPQLFVIEDGRLDGVVRFAAIAEFLQLRNELERR